MIREANEGDCINLAALSLQVWLQTYAIDGIRTENSEYALSTFTEKHFKGLLHKQNYRLLVYVDGIYLRGYTLVNLESRFEGEENGFEIEKLYVQGPFQGKGIGRKLLLEVKARYGDRFWLYTWVRNKSIAFYKKFGFKDIGQYRFEFGSGMIENRVLGFGRT
ncbi:MAG: GNAT family N-acetyltransferase [Desulfobacteraceae bacterium]|nr:GNAT family N-acetyltransferase [Desulfobacteraceae bacterium]